MGDLNVYTYNFNYAYTYDFDLKQSSQAYQTSCIVVVEILNDGTGRLVSSMSGDKGVLSILSCHLYDTYYEFKSLNNYGKKVTSRLGITNNYIDKFWTLTDNNTAIVFSN